MEEDQWEQLAAKIKEGAKKKQEEREEGDKDVQEQGGRCRSRST